MVVLADFDEVVAVVVFGDQNGMNQSLMSRMGMVLEEVVSVGLVVLVTVVECLVSHWAAPNGYIFGPESRVSAGLVLVGMVMVFGGQTVRTLAMYLI